MIKEKVLNNPNHLGVGLAQYLRVSRRCPTWDQNSIILLEIGQIPFLWLDLIDHWSKKKIPVLGLDIVECQV